MERVVMRRLLLFLGIVVALSSFDMQAQQKPRGGRTATLAIFVTDSAGVPVPNVAVTLEGPASRATRTEGGRIALEALPVGRYTLRFEREGFVTLERELSATAGKPVEVKVTLKPLPAPPPPPVEKPKPAVDAKPAVFDVPDVIEKEFVGRAPERITPLACGSEGTATLIQLNQPLAEHTHAEADEFLYVVAGEGSASVNGRQQKLNAGILVFVPRGMPHALAATGRNPVIVLSTRAGEGC
jgi:quercetin dioxygenase-like cupin family protein